MSWTQLALVLAAGLAALVIAELVARIVIRLRDRWYVWLPHQRTELRLDEKALPGLRPIARHSFNRDGERGEKPPQEEGTYRVLIVGGSAAEGYYLDQHDNWPHRLQLMLSKPAALAALGAERVHVGSIARSLVPCEAIRTMLSRILPRYNRLDLIVFFVGASDVLHWLERLAPDHLEDGAIPDEQMFDVTPRLGGRGLRSLALFRVARALQHRLSPRVQVREGVGRRLVALRAQRAAAKRLIDEVPDARPVVSYFGRHFLPTLQLARTHARRVIVVRQPWLDVDLTPEQSRMMWNYALGPLRTQPVDTYLTHRVVARLLRAIDAEASRLAAEAGVEQLDVLSDLDKDLRTFYDYNHFTPHGANQLAELISRHVVGDGAMDAERVPPRSVRGTSRMPQDPLSPSSRA